MGGEGGYFCSYVVTVLRPQISSPKQRGLVGWTNRWEGVEDTQVVGLVAALFPFPPLSGSFHGLKMLRRLVCFPDGRLVFLRENSTFKRTPEWRPPARAESFIPGRRPTHPSVMENRPRREALSARRRLIGPREGQAPRRFDADPPPSGSPSPRSPHFRLFPCPPRQRVTGATLFPASTTSAPEDEPHPGLVGATQRMRTESGPAQLALETPSGSYARHGIYESP